MSATGRGAVRAARDFYQTPDWCIQALVSSFDPDALMGSKLLDAGAGDGRIGRAFAPYGVRVHLLDIEPQEPDVAQGDFLQDGWWSQEQFDLTVGNPPYSFAQQFIDRASSNSDVTVMLTRVNLLGSRSRVEFFRQHPPSKLLVLTPRPSFTGGGTDATEYAWLVFGPRKLFRDPAPFEWLAKGEVPAPQSHLDKNNIA